MNGASGNFKSLFSIVLLLAVLVRCVIPAGFMPSANAQDGGFSIVICSGAGMKTIAVDGDGQPLPDDHHDASDAAPVCPYAPVLAAAPPVPAAALIATLPVQAPYVIAVNNALRDNPMPHSYRAQAPPSPFQI